MRTFIYIEWEGEFSLASWTTIKESSPRRKDPDYKALPPSSANWTDRHKQTPTTADGRITLTTDAQTRPPGKTAPDGDLFPYSNSTLRALFCYFVSSPDSCYLFPPRILFFFSYFISSFIFILFYFSLSLSAAGFAGNGDRIEGKDVIFIFYFKSKITK